MTANRTVMHLVLAIVGLIVSVPYIYNRGVVDPWVTTHFQTLGIASVRLFIFAMLFMGVRSLALLTSHPNVWRDSGHFSSIDRLMTFRENRLKGMTLQEGSELLRQTQALDSATYDDGSATGRTWRYMNDRLAGMTPAQGLEFMKMKRS